MRSLRKLRNERGLSIDDIAERTRMPADALTAAETGPELPSLPVLEAYLRGCGEDLAPWEERLRGLLPEAETRDDLLPVREPGASDAASAGAAAGAAAAPQLQAAKQRPSQPRHTIVRLGPPPTRRTRQAAGIAAAIVVVAALGTGGAILLTGNSGRPNAQGVAPRATRHPATSASPTAAPRPGKVPRPTPTPAPTRNKRGPQQQQQQQQDEPQLAVAGIGCPAAGYDGVQIFNASHGPGWTPDGGGWTGNGCDGNTVWTMNPNGTQGRPSALIWFFHPAASAGSCTLAVFIPVRNSLGTGSYQVFTTGPADPVMVDQDSSAGKWVQLGSYQPEGAPVKIELTPAANPAGPDGRIHGHHHDGPGHNSSVAASAASASCA